MIFWITGAMFTYGIILAQNDEEGFDIITCVLAALMCAFVWPFMIGVEVADFLKKP